MTANGVISRPAFSGDLHDFPHPDSLAPLTGITWERKTSADPEREAAYRASDPFPVGFGNALRAVVHDYRTVYKQTEALVREASKQAEAQAVAKARQEAEIAAAVEAGNSLVNVWRRAGHLTESIPEPFIFKAVSAALRRLERYRRAVSEQAAPQGEALRRWFQNEQGRTTHEGRRIPPDEVALSALDELLGELVEAT